MKKIRRTRAQIIAEMRLASAHKKSEAVLAKAYFESWDSSRTEDGTLICACNIESPELRDAIIEMKRSWLVSVVVLCIDAEGEEYHRYSHLMVDDTRLNDLTGDYNELMQDLISRQNQDHIVDSGRIIRPLTPALEREISESGTDGVNEHLVSNRFLEMRFEKLDKRLTA